ncbi:MAG: hypothetical protein QM503_00695 [Bacteroidota bacterium]
MLSFFKSSKKKTPKKGATFYHRENKIQTIEELNIILKRLSSTTSTLTNSNILFQGFELDSISEKSLEKDFGEESFLLEPDSDILNHKVYYYRIASSSLRFLIQIHFIGDEFFFATTKVYSDSLLSQSDKQKVTSQIISKYYPNADSDTIDFKLKDPKGNILFTHDHVYYYIQYLPNNALNQKLIKQYGSFKRVDANQEINDTLDKLI